MLSDAKSQKWGIDLKQAVKELRAEKAWREGWTGKGVRVAVLDTGVAKHPDLKKRLILFQDFVNGAVRAMIMDMELMYRGFCAGKELFRENIAELRLRQI